MKTANNKWLIAPCCSILREDNNSLKELKEFKKLSKKSLFPDPQPLFLNMSKNFSVII
jgi:hypothetical protein